METTMIVLLTIALLTSMLKHIIWILYGIILIKDRIEERIEMQIERQVKEICESQNITVS